MSKRPKAIPDFANEAAERAFWEENDSADYLDWAKAQAVAFPNIKLSTQTISLRLPQHLLDSIKSAANSRDVPCQSLIKVWLQEKVSSRKRAGSPRGLPRNLSQRKGSRSRRRSPIPVG
jgi:predicted DNA binding CopG/RHH family protein